MHFLEDGVNFAAGLFALCFEIRCRLIDDWRYLFHLLRSQL